MTTERTFTFGRWTVGDDTRPLLILELGSNHGGSVDTARTSIARHVEAARSADPAIPLAVKTQARTNRRLYTRAFYDSPYASENAYGPTYGAHREALELSTDQHQQLQAFCASLGVEYFATPFDPEAADRLLALGVPGFKIASADLTNTPLIAHVAAFGLPIILSTGGGEMGDIIRATYAARPAPVAILHCTAEYPCPAADLNLRAIARLRDVNEGLVMGLSSHYSGIIDVPVAYALGARIFEKHITHDRTAKGTDHAFSLEPDGTRAMVAYLAQTRDALGDGWKRRLAAEAAPLAKMAKSLVAARALPAGHVLAAEDILIRSPGGGVAPWKRDRLVGQRLAAPVAGEDLLSS